MKNVYEYQDVQWLIKKKNVVKRTAKYDQRFFTIINAEYRKSHEQDNRKICPDVFDKNASSGQN